MARFRQPSGNGSAVMFHPDVPHRVSEVGVEDPAESADHDNRRLTVGRDISLSGCEIADCERLTIEGTVEAAMRGGRLLEIEKGGCFRGSASVDNADIAGVFEGDLKVGNRLTVQASGCITGTVSYGQLEIERGGRINGTVGYDAAGREADLQPVGIAPPRAADGSLDS